MTVVHLTPSPSIVAEKIARVIGTLTLGLAFAFGSSAPAFADPLVSNLPLVTTLPVGITADTSSNSASADPTSHAARIKKLRRNPKFRKLTKQLKLDQHRLHRLEARTLRHAHGAADRLRLLRKFHRTRAFRRLEKKIRLEERRLHRLEGGHALPATVVTKADATSTATDESFPKHNSIRVQKDFPLLEIGLGVMGVMLLYTLLRPKKKATGDGLTLKERKMTYS
jgi:hypothetical protein